ncbi:hypothetical protein JZX87_29050 [Agrobacterium sp. Ap1]|uniref:hypothetical protein n=1 Tax=Rhizobium/Agrobacterium group TaxID=227290 RepID=UPI001573017D|nr:MULTISPECIES: hypothetical protein [Rhizobium/Agrobacterium group]MBO0145181.1 hypothetical protein [Agrobacterium sp. Ap1]NTF98300.1 hypothetical protein [Rhizobium rhizogenes]
MLEPVGHLAGRPLEVRDHIEFEIIVNRALAPDRAAHLSLPRTGTTTRQITSNRYFSNKPSKGGGAGARWFFRFSARWRDFALISASTIEHVALLDTVEVFSLSGEPGHG